MLVDGCMCSIIVNVTAMISTTDLDRQTTVTGSVAATTVRYVEVIKHSASTQVYFPVYFTFTYFFRVTVVEFISSSDKKKG